MSREKADRKSPWLKFYPADWRADPKLRMCSIAARGLWMEMICLMWEAAQRGYLLVSDRAVTPKQLASLAGISPKECSALLAELQEAAVFSVNDDGAIYSRRMVRDEEKAERQAQNGNAGGNPTLLRGTVPKEQRVRPFKRSDAPAKTKRIFEKSGGRCHWCRTALIWEGDGTGAQPNLFHVDHVVAVRDGGTNDEENLVAACAECNHKRARADYQTPTCNEIPTPTEVSVGCVADAKAHSTRTSAYHIPDTREFSSQDMADAISIEERPAQPAASLPAEQSDEDKLWSLAKDCEAKGIARSRLGRLINLAHGGATTMSAATSLVVSSLKAKNPSTYFGAAIREIEADAGITRAKQLQNGKKVPPWVAEWREAGETVTSIGPNQWSSRGKTYDDEGRLTGW